MNITEIVSQNQDVLHGALVFAGTRVPVASLLDHLKAGDTLEDFLAGFPSVSRQQAEAFLEFQYFTNLTQSHEERKGNHLQLRGLAPSREAKS